MRLASGMPHLRIFLSSTALDLEKHRQVADDTLLRLQQQAVIMERFGPLPNAPVAECEARAASCDLLVCIVAHRYGYAPDPGGDSITRREVDAARRAGKPVLVWIVDDSHPWTEIKDSDRLNHADVRTDPAKVREVLAQINSLNEFKDWLRRELSCEAFTTPDDLGRKIGIAVANHVAKLAPVQNGVAPVPRAELRIVHALQPAPYFAGRDQLVSKLSTWVDDIASPDRLWALVAAGGTGKTAIAEQVVAGLLRRERAAGAGNVLVWSFYERPDADAFFRECAQLFLQEPDDAPAGGRLERLQRGLRDGRPHLVVLDGLERVQAEAGPGRSRGELEDHQLKLLLQAIAAGLGRTRALVTSRFALTDLRDWEHRGLVLTELDDLPEKAARQVLRGWGVQGADEQLDEVANQVGRHALSVAVIGSYLRHFEQGRVEAAAGLNLHATAGDDPKAAKLARVLGFYAQRLPADERELLARLSVFPRGITLELLGMLVDAGGAVAGALVNAKPALVKLLTRLVERGLAFRYETRDRSLTWTAHPFVRQSFAELLACPAESVFDAVAGGLSVGLEERPKNKPRSAELLDRYEQWVEATRLAGRVGEAFDLYWFGLGAYVTLAKTLGDYARGYRILQGFLPASGEFAGFGAGLPERERGLGINDLGMFARQLGRLTKAEALHHESTRLARRTADPTEISVGLQNCSMLAHDLGQLTSLLDLAQQALAEAQRAQSEEQRLYAVSYRALAHHRLGQMDAARADFVAATALENQPMLYSRRGMHHAHHLLEGGLFVECREVINAGLTISRNEGWNDEVPGWQVLLARLALAEGGSVDQHLASIRGWTASTGDMEWIIEAHGIAARDALVRGDLRAGLAEADDGLRLATQCGYRLKAIELGVTLSAIHLAWPDTGTAEAAARQALDLAIAPDCCDAWGEADAAHAWGLAFAAQGRPEQARRAFEQALAVRERISHPQTQATRDALAKLG